MAKASFKFELVRLVLANFFLSVFHINLDLNNENK